MTSVPRMRRRSIVFRGVAGATLLLPSLQACVPRTVAPSSSDGFTAGPISDRGGTPPRSGRDPTTLPPPLARSLAAPAARGSTAPTIIDTDDFARRIDRRRFIGEEARPAKYLPRHRTPPLPPAAGDNGLRFGRLDPVARTAPELAFPGISQTPWSPPDPSIAVGTDHVVATVNMKIAWYDKEGTPQFEQFLDSTGDPGFLEEVGGGSFTFDPKCFHDPFVDRYVVLALEYYQDTAESWITLAISDDGDPNGLWFKYRTWALVESQGSRYWVDYPGFGYDERGWYVTANLYELGDGPGPGFLGGLLRVIDKTGPLAGEPMEWADLLAGGASWQVAQVPQAGESARIVRQSSANSIELGLVVDAPENPSIQTSSVPVPQVAGDSAAPTPVGNGLWIVDRRMMNATLRNDVLWCTNHGVVQGDSSASAVWYAIDCAGPTPTYLQGGAFRFGGQEHSFFPAIAVAGDGDVGVVYGRSSPDRHPSLEIAGRRATDPPGAMSIGVEIGSSVTSPNGNPSGLNRWGDYFDCTVDPVDDRTFWAAGELQTESGWITEIHRFTVGGVADLDGNGVVNAGDVAILLAAFGTAGGPADLNRDGVVNGFDLGLLMGDWGE